jgi:hypothetical protein
MDHYKPNSLDQIFDEDWPGISATTISHQMNVNFRTYVAWWNNNQWNYASTAAPYTGKLWYSAVWQFTRTPGFCKNELGQGFMAGSIQAGDEEGSPPPLSLCP